MNRDRLLYLNDNARSVDTCNFERKRGDYLFTPQRIASKVEFYDDDTGEMLWEPLHNKTVIAGSALTAMKLFNLDRQVLTNTPSYDMPASQGGLNLLNANPDGSAYPAIDIISNEGTGAIVGSVEEECQRKILGFCVGQGGAGLDISDVFEVKYCSWITPDDIIPFRYPLQDEDNVDENMYKGKAEPPVTGEPRYAYYFKKFSNEPALVQNYISSVGTYSDSVSANTVYSNTFTADKAQSYVELHLKVTREDCREFFIAHNGIENAKINQISLVYGWEKDVEVTKNVEEGSYKTGVYSYFQDVRPFSLLNIPNEIMSNLEKSLSIIYTLYF